MPAFGNNRVCFCVWRLVAALVSLGGWVCAQTEVSPVAGSRAGNVQFKTVCPSGTLVDFVAAGNGQRMNNLEITCGAPLTQSASIQSVFLGSTSSVSGSIFMHQYDGIVGIAVSADGNSVCQLGVYGVDFTMRVVSGSSSCGSTQTWNQVCPVGMKGVGFYGQGGSGDAVYQLGLVCSQVQCNANDASSASAGQYCTCLDPTTVWSLGQCQSCQSYSLLCGVGYYLSGCGGRSSGGCTPCSAPPSGYYWTGNGGVSNSCPVAACVTCGLGQYTSGCGGASAGACSACTSPPSGYYWTGGGGLSSSCPVSACVSCGVGQYTSGCGGASAGACALCTLSSSGVGSGVGVYFSSSGGLTGACGTVACPAGTYMSGGVPQPNVCTPASPGYYVGSTGALAQTPCAAGTYSFLLSQSACLLLCPSGTYGTVLGATAFSVACPSSCAAGRYGTAPGATSAASACPSLCPAGTYGTAQGATSPATACPTPCPAGTYGTAQGATSAASACPSRCLAGTYGVVLGAVTVAAACGSTCPVGTYGTALGATSASTACLSACAAGTYGVTVGATAAALACAGCVAGTYGAVAGAVSPASGCAGQCAAGTYGTASAATSQATACPSSCAPGTYGAALGATSAATACASACVGGSYGTAAGATSAATACPSLCAAGTYGTALGATSAATACPTPCPAATYGVARGQITLAAACPYSCAAGTYGNSTGGTSAATACPYACPASTYALTTGQTSQALACAGCASCYPGSMIVTPCAGSVQVVCAALLTNLYLVNTAVGVTVTTAQITAFAPGPGALVPGGLMPTVYTVPTALAGYTHWMLPTYLTNLNGASQKDPGLYISIPLLAPCPPLPVGRVFLSAWSPPAVFSVTCTSNPDTCLTTPVQCDVGYASQCSGLISASAGGYYLPAGAGIEAACVPCTTSSTYAPCDWGQYANLNGCAPNSNTTCAACYGAALPANAQWTVPNAPYYFAGAPSCAWACNVGFYPDPATGLTCLPCYLPPNGTFVPGEMGGANFVTLRPGVQKLFGGSVTYGCNVVCAVNTYLQTLAIGQTTFNMYNVRCQPCQAVSCALGYYGAPDAQNCLHCVPCPTVDDAAFLMPGACQTVCNAGYYNYGQVCQQCATPTCALGVSYATPCGTRSNAVCAACTPACPIATYTVSTCTLTADRVCAPCPTTQLVNGVVGPECVLTCNANYAYNNATRQCQACAVALLQCPVNTQLVPCESVYFGCKPCATPTAYGSAAWCWTGSVEVPCQTALISAVGVAGCRLIPPAFVSAALAAPTTTTTAIIINPTTTAVSAAIPTSGLYNPSTLFALSSSSPSSPSSYSSALNTPALSSSLFTYDYALSTTTTTTITVNPTAAAVTSTGLGGSAVIIQYDSSSSSSSHHFTSTSASHPHSTTSTTTTTTTTPTPAGAGTNLSLFSLQLYNQTALDQLECVAPLVNHSLIELFDPSARVVALVDDSGQIVQCVNFACPPCVDGNWTAGTNRRFLLQQASSPSYGQILFQIDLADPQNNRTVLLLLEHLLSSLHLHHAQLTLLSVRAAASHAWVDLSTWAVELGNDLRNALSSDDSASAVVVIVSVLMAVALITTIGVLLWKFEPLFFH